METNLDEVAPDITWTTGADLASGESASRPVSGPAHGSRKAAHAHPSSEHGLESPWLDSAPKLRCRLERMAAHLSPHPSWHEDLIQEALIHWWQRQRLHPGQSASWYLRSCEFHLKNWLRRGRSIDSLKRRHGRETELWNGNSSTKDWILNSLADESRESSVLEVVSVRDLVSVLEPRLTLAESRVLSCLLVGLGTRETARQLKVSHTYVTRSRRRIAAGVLALEK